MSKKEQFIAAIQKSYQTDKPVIHLGSAILDGEIIGEARVNLPLRMMNRHGLVAGATGSGKTRTLQVFAEQLSAAGVPVFMSDIKGDLSGIAQPGKTNAALEERAQILGTVFEPKGFPVELYSLSGNKGAQMRATVLEFGPILLSKIFELNETQAGVLAILFKYADDKDLPMVDLNDLKKSSTTSPKARAPMKSKPITVPFPRPQPARSCVKSSHWNNKAWVPFSENGHSTFPT